jgi:hypothetical protein
MTTVGKKAFIGKKYIITILAFGHTFIKLYLVFNINIPKKRRKVYECDNCVTTLKQTKGYSNE